MALFQQCASTRASSTSRTRPGKWHVIRNVSVPTLRLVPTDVSPSKSNMRRKNKREWGVGEERIVVFFFGGGRVSVVNAREEKVGENVSIYSWRIVWC